MKINYCCKSQGIGQTTFKPSSVSNSSFSIKALQLMLDWSPKERHESLQPLRLFFHSSWAFYRFASTFLSSSSVIICAFDFLNGSIYNLSSSISFFLCSIRDFNLSFVSPAVASLHCGTRVLFDSVMAANSSFLTCICSSRIWSCSSLAVSNKSWLIRKTLAFPYSFITNILPVTRSSIT